MAKTSASTKGRGMPPRVAAFVREYAKSGNATKAAIAAGYSTRTSYAQGCRLLKNAEVREALASLAAKVESVAIADATERRQFWSRVMRGEVDGFDSKDRLKASELLGKTAGDFLDRIEHSGKVEGSLIVYMPDNGRG